MSIFNDLKAYPDEVVAVEQGPVKASRVTSYEVADVKAIRA